MKNNQELQTDIQNATKRESLLNALKGELPWNYQKEEAGRIAWNTPGIWHLKNDPAVDYYYALVN